ncbi:MAG: ATP12 family protein [Rhizobiaceae bacterium]|nr:ATP12 family protein [Rhizobiaceae bacterium]
MRDILEDAEGAVERGDIGPGKANRGQDKPNFPKRFYKTVNVVGADASFGVELDGRVVKTPGRANLFLPTEASAQLVANEWDAIEDEINPLKMPVTRLANTAVDGVANEAQAVMEDIVRYASSDLLCYRADGPEGLIEAQRKHWDPILDWADEAVGARFELAEGIMHVSQPKEAIVAFGNTLKKHEDPFKLACVHTFTSLSGSALIALALAEQFLDVDAAWNAAHVDEDWNISQWGEDYEAAERRKQRWTDFEAAHNLFTSV